MKYNVIYSYCINVEAEDDNEAQDKADKIWMEITPRVDEMMVDVEPAD